MMSGATRRKSVSSSASAKRPSVAGENALAKAPKATVAAAAVEQAKKRVALGNITNQGNAVGRNPPERLRGVKGANKVGVASSTSAVKKEPLTSTCNTRSLQKTVTAPSAVNLNIIAPRNDVLSTYDEPMPTIKACLAPEDNIVPHSPSGDSSSSDETMSTCDSMKSPDIEYIDNGDSIFASLERRANENLHISENRCPAGPKWNMDVPATMEVDDVIDVDTNHEDPQFCTTLACDIYRHLRSAETKKRPCTDFMETIQKDINASMRSILIDWLVEVSEEYRLVPDTLYLAVNYIDRYLSGNEMSRQRLQLLGVACMLIASKYEEVCAPQVEEFCYITDNTYFKDEVLQMEADVLKYLKFEMTAPTAKCFLRRFVRAAQGCSEVPTLQLEFLANYVAELSLLEYSFLTYSPSTIAASAVFLAKFVLQPTKRPWNATLCHYTLYKPSDLCECVKALHLLLCNSPSNGLPAIREKYSQHKYKYVAKKYCPPAVPSEFFEDAVN